MSNQKAVNYMTEQVCDFIRENPVILRAMARGYKAQLSFDLPPKNEKELKIDCNVIIDDNSEPIKLKNIFL